MNTKAMVATALTGALAIIGCVSVDSTRTQLASSNPQDVKKAEENIFVIATTGKDAFGIVEFTRDQQIEYVNLASNNALLLRILDKTSDEKIIVSAARRIDFTKPGVGMEILTKHEGVIDKVVRAEGRAGRENAASKSSGDFSDKVFASFKEGELRKAMEMRSVASEYKRKIALCLAGVTEDVTTLVALHDGDLKHLIRDDDQGVVVARLVALSGNVNDAAVIVKILKSGYVKDVDQRKKLIARLPEKDAVEFALNGVETHSLHNWNMRETIPLDDALSVAENVKDPQSVVKVILAVLAKLASYKKECETSWTYSWDKEDKEKESALIKRIPKFDDATVEALICADETSWPYFIDVVSPAVAYNVLAGGKAKSRALEMALVKKLPSGKVDMKVFNGVRFADSKKAVNDAMSPEMRKAATEAMADAFKAIREKAKAAAKDTFELDGFYLGMSFDDMKVVFAQHFPKLEIKEVVDGKGEKADYVIYVPGQSTPFCYAGVSDKKVWQFNFGKKLLKKWYQFDVQTPIEWASAYSQATKIDMKFKMIEKETTVYESDMSRSYRVWFRQESYQYKHNAKEYRLIYFGEEKDFTFHGGIGGALIKEKAARDFRYIRGDEGTLRATVAND